MSWLEAIVRVLAESGVAMDYKEIIKQIQVKGYKHHNSEDPRFTVNPILNNKVGRKEIIPHLFKNVGVGEYELTDDGKKFAVTLVSPTASPAAGKTVGRATTVARPSTAYNPGDPKYKSASDFIESIVPSQTERDLFELIVNFRLPLETVEMCFADILDDMEPIEFSSEKKNTSKLVDAALLHKKLDELNEKIAKMEAKIQKGHNLSDSYGLLLQSMKAAAGEIKSRLADSGDKVEVRYPKWGEFIPESEESPCKPRVVIYYENIKSSCPERWPLMAGVFVHEMFHAWNYVRAERNQRSVLAIDEPMVEFETLYFLKELKTFTELNSHSLRDEVSRVNRESERSVQKKQRSVSEVAAYGFGYYLFKNLRDDSVNWVETYSEKSASINDSGSHVKKLVEKVEAALIPIYPFMSEAKVMKWFKNIIF